MAWCESHSDIWNHWKLDRLQSLIAADLPLGLDSEEQRVYLVGSLHALFHFALDNSWRAGDLSKWGDAGIERAAKWRRKPGAMVSALRESTFLEGSTIKGWSERAGLLIKKRVERENVNRERAGLPPASINAGAERVPNGTRAEPERGPTVKDTTDNTHSTEQTYNQEATAPKSQRPERALAFKRPTVEEVEAYCVERGGKVDAQKWFDHYTANGWKVGQNAMKDWKAAVRKWERSDFNSKGAGGHAEAAQERKYEHLAS